jgi:hypothetical protein
MALNSDQLNEIMIAIATGAPMSTLNFPITRAVRTAWRRIEKEMREQPGPVMVQPMYEFSSFQFDDLIAASERAWGKG